MEIFFADAGSQKEIFGCLYRQYRLPYPPCPITTMNVNGAPTIVHQVSVVFWGVTGCALS
jgi:hypothetical protein